MPRTHTYLRTHSLAGKILGFDLAAEDAKLQQQASAAKSRRAAKTLVKEGRLRVTLVALRKGAVLGAHTVEGDVSLQVLRGAFEVRTVQRRIRGRKGSLIVLRASVEHEATATRDTTVLITASMR